MYEFFLLNNNESATSFADLSLSQRLSVHFHIEQHTHRVARFFPVIHRPTGKPHKTFEAVLLSFPLAVSSLHLLLRFHHSLLTKDRSCKQTPSELCTSLVLNLIKQGRRKKNPEAESSRHDLPGSLACVICPPALHRLASFVGKCSVRKPIIRFKMRHC